MTSSTPSITPGSYRFKGVLKLPGSATTISFPDWNEGQVYIRNSHLRDLYAYVTLNSRPIVAPFDDFCGEWKRNG